MDPMSSPLVLLAYATVHGDLATPLVAATINPQLCGNLDPRALLKVCADRMGLTRYEVMTDTDVAVQPDLFPNPEKPSCTLHRTPKLSIV